MINMYETLDSLSFKEIMGYSIEAEENAYQFYTKMADGLSELPAQRYHSLASDEKMHKSELLKLHKRLFGNDKYVVPDKEGLPPHEGDVNIDTIINLIQSLDAAIKSEHNAYEIYTYLAKNQPEHKKFFKLLAAMEHGHYESLKAEKKMYEEGVDTKEIKGSEDPSIWIREERENISSKVR